MIPAWLGDIQLRLAFVNSYKDRHGIQIGLIHMSENAISESDAFRDPCRSTRNFHIETLVHEPHEGRSFLYDTMARERGYTSSCTREDQAISTFC